MTRFMAPTIGCLAASRHYVDETNGDAYTPGNIEQSWWSRVSARVRDIPHVRL